MPTLQVSLPDNPNASFELVDDVVTVGRLSDNTVQLEDASVSSHHAELRLSGDDYVFIDIGSTNGSRLNGRNVEADQEMPLRSGDRVLFGNIESVYESDTPPGESSRPMPEADDFAVTPAESSVKPLDFENASPFQKKTTKKDPAGVGIMVLAVLSLLVFGAAVALVLGLQPPTL